jgi:hypothetical protein
MKIEIGKVFLTKLLSICYLVLNFWEEMILKLNLIRVHVLASEVHDTLMDGTPYEGARLVYLYWIS